jgi:hypothetical protein
MARSCHVPRHSSFSIPVFLVVLRAPFASFVVVPGPAMQRFAPNFAPIGCIYDGCTLHCIRFKGDLSRRCTQMNADNSKP